MTPEREHGDDRDVYGLMMEVCFKVDDLVKKVDKLDNAVRARIPPGFLWLIGACAVLMTSAVMWDVFGTGPVETSPRVRYSAAQHQHDRDRNRPFSHATPSIRTAEWIAYDADHNPARMCRLPLATAMGAARP